MADKPFDLSASGIGPLDPRQVSRFLAAQYLVLEFKTNTDLLAEFCHLVVLLDLEHGKPPQDLLALVHGVTENPESDKLRAAIKELNDYADRLPDDPREQTNAVADAWKQSKKIREGKALAKLDGRLAPDRSSSNEISKGFIPIQVQVWSQTEGKMDNPTSEIRCMVPRLSMVANLHNIIRYAARAACNFPYSDGKLRRTAEELIISSKAMLYSTSSAIDWALREKSTRLGDVVGDAHRLHIVNTKLKTLAVAVAVRYPHELSKHYIFDISEPLKLGPLLRDFTTETLLRLNIEPQKKRLPQTRFLTIVPEEAALPPSSSRDLRTALPARHSAFKPPSPASSTSSLTYAVSWIATHPSVTSLASTLSSTESLSSTQSSPESIQDTIYGGIEGRSGRSSPASSYGSSRTIQPRRSASDPIPVADPVTLEEELVTGMENLDSQRGITEWLAGVGSHKLSREAMESLDRQHSDPLPLGSDELRSLTILPEELPFPPATSSDRDPMVDPYVIDSSAMPFHQAPSSQSLVPYSYRAKPQEDHSQLQPPPAQAHQPPTVGPQLSVDRRFADLRSPSPASSHSSDTLDDFEKVSSQVPHSPENRLSVRPPSRMPMVSAASSSSLVVVDTLAIPNAIFPKPENPAGVGSAARVPKPDSFGKRVIKRTWG